MPTADLGPFAGRTAVLATMHGKEAVIGPLLAEGAGLRVEVAPGLDTDRFGTFTQEVPRAGDQREAALAKAEAALALTGAALAIASEGSFGPHPGLPWVAADWELVVLVDRATPLTLVGRALSAETNFAQRVVGSVDEAIAFAARAGAPAHGLIVREGPAHDDPVAAKGVTDPAALAALVGRALAAAPGGRVLVETDMRAHMNPTRQQAIAAATRDLIRLIHARCPACARAGFDVVEVRAGLPCAWCGAPTRLALAHWLGCEGCGHRASVPFPAGRREADPGRCDRCNP